MLALFLMLASAWAGALFGVDYVPFGRADLAWVDSGQISGTQVAETDGLLSPPLRAWAGPAGPRGAWLFGLSAARVSTSVQTAESRQHSSRTGLRLSADHRRYLCERAVDTPLPYLVGGVVGVVPFASETADGSSKSDTKAMEKQADQDRARIGSVGLRLGGGGEVQWKNGLVLGFSTTLLLHRAQSTDEQTRTVSTVLRPEGAITLAIAL